MSHVVHSASSRRHRRNRRTAIILVLLIAALGGAFYYAASYFNKGPSSAASGCPTGAATAAPGKPLAPGQVTVNVYNATSRAGLAADTAKQVKARGFVVGSVANDPAKKTVQGVAEVRFGPNGKQAAALVAKQLTGAASVQDTRADATVDLVLGNAYKGLNPGPTATAPPDDAGPC